MAGIPIHPGDFRAVACERLRQASELMREKNYALAMYLYGLAAECMLRAFHRPDQDYSNPSHDLLAAYKACDSERLGDEARRRLRGPIQTVRALWQNRFRYFSEDRVRAHLKALEQDRRLPRGADLLKARSKDLADASTEIVTVGETRWKARR